MYRIVKMSSSLLAVEVDLDVLPDIGLNKRDVIILSA